MGTFVFDGCGKADEIADCFLSIGEHTFCKGYQGNSCSYDVQPENTPSLPCDGLQRLTETGEWRAKQPWLILITRLPQRGPHLSMRLASWDELTSDRILPRRTWFCKPVLQVYEKQRDVTQLQQDAPVFRHETFMFMLVSLKPS